MEHFQDFSRQIARSEFRPYSFGTPSVVFYKNKGLHFDNVDYYFSFTQIARFLETAWLSRDGKEYFLRSIIFREEY